MLNKLITLTLLITFIFPIFGQEKKARRIVETLCSDSMAGRGYVENGVNKAAKFIKQEFINVGLKPFFKKNRYFQKYHFDVNTFPGEMLIENHRDTLRPGIDYLVNENSGSFQGKLNMKKIDTAVFSNQDILLPALEALKNGKVNSFYFDLTSIDKPNDLYKRVYQLSQLASLCPIIVVTDQKFTWSVGHQQFKYPIILVKPNKIKASDKPTLNIEATIVKNFQCSNIAGILPSSKKGADTIVFTAHYDHLGEMGTKPKPTIFPGGNDNASGTSMLISMAQYFSKHPVDHTIIFIAFSGEEAGLYGSHYFVNHSPIDLSTIRFLVNLDIMGSGEEGITVVNGKIYTKTYQTLVSINEKHHYLSDIAARGETANSDHYFFYKAGVPSFFIYTRGPNKNYHDVYDTYENLSFAAYNNIVKLLVDFVGKL